MDVTLNEDKLCRDSGGIWVPHTDMYIPGSLTRYAVTPITEPVTLAEAKAYMKISYGTDDAIITRLITGARQWCEQRCGQSLVLTDIEVTINVANFFELPYGPIETPTGITGVDQNYINKGQFPTVSGTKGQFRVTYRAGYAAAPEWAKNAILARVAATYENRGDQDKTNYSQVALSHLLPEKRITAWV